MIRSTTYNKTRRGTSSCSDCHVTMLEPTWGREFMGRLHNADHSDDAKRSPSRLSINASLQRCRSGWVWVSYSQGSDGLLLRPWLSFGIMGMWGHAVSSGHLFRCCSQGTVLFTTHHLLYFNLFHYVIQLHLLLVSWWDQWGVGGNLSLRCCWHDSFRRIWYVA